MAQPIVTVEVKGLKELEQRLRDEPKKIAVRVTRSAGRRAGQIFQTALEQHAPRLTGFLATHIGVATKATSGAEGSIRVVIGLKPGEFTKGGRVHSWRPFWGLFQEFGTRFQPPKPWARPAFEQVKGQALNVFIEELRDNLDALKE